MSVTLIRDGIIRHDRHDTQVATAMLPSICPQNHAANLLPLPDGALKSLTAGVGVRYIGTSYGDAKNTFKVPAVDLYDAMVSYELGELNSSLKGAQVQFNVNNIADTKYVASCASDSACFYGIGRTVTATVNYAW